MTKGRDFGKSIFLGLGSVLKTSFDSTMLQDVRILPTFVYFHPMGGFGYISTLRSHLALFSTLRGRLEWVKMTLISVLRPVCCQFCVLICGCV